MSAKVSGLGLLALAVTSQAFRVTFWKGPSCTDKSLAHSEVTYNDGAATCFNYDAIHEAQSATVVREAADPRPFVVGFWGTPNCGEDQGYDAGKGYTASIDSGCIDLRFGYYGSMAVAYADQDYKRDAGGDSPLQINETVQMELDPFNTGLDEFDWLQRYMAEDPEGLERRREASKNGTGSLNPAFNPDFLEHGSYGEFNGREIRYHQVARGILVGVYSEDWDDEVHVKDDTILEWGDSYPIDFGSGPGSEIEVDWSRWGNGTSPNPRYLRHRDFAAMCSSGTQCARRVFTDSTNWVYNLINGFGNGVVAQYNRAVRLGNTARRYAWDFINDHPGIVIQNVVDRAGGVVDGVIAGAVNRAIASNQDRDAMNSCSGTTIIQTMIQGCQRETQGTPTETVTVILEPYTINNYYTVTVAASEDGKAHNDQCGGVSVPAPTKKKLKARIPAHFFS